MAFLLRPDIGPGGIERTSTGSNQLSEPMRTQAVEAGLANMSRPSKTPYSLPSLEATEYAKEHGKFDQFHRLCYQALWEEGKDLEDFEVLKSIARECSLDWPELEDRLKTEYYRSEIMQQYLQGKQLGFQGIPGFIIGNNGFTGAAPYDLFRSAAQRASEWINGQRSTDGGI